MKILLAHTFYRSSAPSGEDAVYLNERKLLEEHFDVVRFEKYNDDLDDSTLGKQIGLALSGAWSKTTYQELSRLIKQTRPDLAHFHNTFPQLTPSAWAACQDQGVPVVQTLHNFRFICPGALLQRDGKPCEDCIDGSIINALKHRCYRDSIPTTGAQVWTIVRNRWNGSFRNNVNRYIALTEFAASRLAAGGLPREKITIKPNFLLDTPAMGKGEGGYIIYTGRLSEEKGIKTLLKAWQQIDSPITLKLAGDGPLRQELEQYCLSHRLNVEFLGFCARQNILELVGDALLQVVPSEWYEGFPMVILEAYSCGTPVLASRIGSLNEIVQEGETGYKFSPGDVESLTSTLRSILSDLDSLKLMRPTVRQVFLDQYTAECNLARTRKIYEQVIENTPANARV
ncbi:MAG: glycosyltransferase family 1 protein [Thiothrix sp.]|nr:MAG: glycosyltransferase family 1 protein [Thiothrix sp.]